MKLIEKKKEQGAAHPTLHCSLCDAPLFSKVEIRGHLLSAHLDVYEQIKTSADADADEEPQRRGSSKWKCGECQLVVDSEQLFFSHVKSSHPTTPFYCTIASCNHLLFASLISLRDHHRKEHYHSKFNIPLMDDDGAESHPDLVKECECCQTKFLRQAELTKHVKTKHPESHWPCPHPQCKLLFYTEQLLETHVSNCSKNAERKGKKRSKKIKTTARKRKAGECETDQEESESESKANRVEKESDSKSRRVVKPSKSRRVVKPRRVRKSNAKTSQLIINKCARTQDDGKLKMEVKVVLIRLTQEEIDYYTEF